MNIHEILEVLQWVVFTSLGYHLFDRHLSGTLGELSDRQTSESIRRQEQVDKIQDRATELIDRVHAVECQQIHLAHRVDEADPPD